MHHIQRVRGVKYDLSTFSLAELGAAVGHARRHLEEQQRFLTALVRERERRLAAGETGAGTAGSSSRLSPAGHAPA